MSLRSLLNTHKSTYNLYKKDFSVIRLCKEGALFVKDYFFDIGNGFPTNINLVLTNRCNQACEICYDSKILNKNSEELNLKELERLVDSVKSKKPLFFITGGEPFMRKDIFLLLDYLKKNKLSFGICTNGSALTEEMIRQLANLNPANIVFSIHGTEKVHDELTGRKGNYAKAMKNLKEFCKLKKDTYVLVNYVLQEKNASCLENFIEEATFAGADAVRVQYLGFITPEELKYQDLIWKKCFKGTPPAINQYVLKAPKFNFEKNIRRIESKKFKIPVFFKPYLNQEEMKPWHDAVFGIKRKCLFLWKAAYIAPNGDVFPCQTIKLKLGNIKEKSLEEIYNSSKARKLRGTIKKGLLPACARCCKL
jgi:Fe-coproporphyrin III synthase